MGDVYDDLDTPVSELSVEMPHKLSISELASSESSSVKPQRPRKGARGGRRA